MEVIKEPLEDTLTDIFWNYMNNDHDFYATTCNFLDHETAAIVAMAGVTKAEFIKGGASLLKTHVAMKLKTESNNPLCIELHKALLNAVDFEALAMKFFEEN